MLILLVCGYVMMKESVVLRFFFLIIIGSMVLRLKWCGFLIFMVFECIFLMDGWC